LNALKLLELDADAKLGDSEDLPTSALYQCVVASLEDLMLAEELCQRGLGVDDGPSDYETPFMFAVRKLRPLREGALLFRSSTSSIVCLVTLDHI
jgi:hypothetical protein